MNYFSKLSFKVLKSTGAGVKQTAADNSALGIKTNCSEIVYALGMPELVLDVSQP